MVQSKLSDVVYDETTEIHDDDDDFECNAYEMTFPSIDNVPRSVVFGNKKHDYEHKKIIYFPIYLVIDEEVKDRIGVYETYLEELPSVYDEEKEIDAQQVKPLLFSFVTKPYLESFQKLELELPDEDEKPVCIGETLQEDDLDIESIDESEDDVFDIKVKESKNSKKSSEDELFELDVNKNMPNMLSEESKSDAKENKKRFKESSNNNWVQRFMKNNNYSILENEGNGDCFFAVVRDAFKQVGKNTSISKLRNAVSAKVNKDVFETYRQIYLDIDDEIGEFRKEIEKQENAIKQYKQRIKHIKTKQEHLEIVEKAKECSKIVKELRKKLKENEDFIKEHFSFMSNIRNYDEFIDYVKTEKCWTEPWIINLLESILNVKFIILSEEAYQSGDLDGVLFCGDKISTIFQPDFYIIVTHANKRYKLVSYKQKHMLVYREIPYDIKSLIMNKCMEKNSGIYDSIEDFKRLKEQLHIDDYDSEDEPDYNLFQDDMEFRFYANSRDAYPGEGSGEKTPKKKMAAFKSLAKIKDWRKKLDHTYLKAPFTLDGRKWASVEHYYNAAKYKKGHPDYYYSFSLDSDSDISKKPLEKGKKSSSMRIDPDFYSERNLEEKKKAIEAKFSQHEELRNLLVQTSPAKLVHFQRGNSPEPDVELMEVRQKLEKN